jgi:glycosyltransferase involved in cell wall biosynthesis
MILPSIEDANGIVVQEAMATGLVPICLDWGGPQLLIENEVSGYLVNPHRVEEIAPAIAQCLDRLAADPRLTSEMSTRARQRAEQWKWSRVTQEWLSQYNALAARFNYPSVGE